jgi:hypothetical protein
MLRRRSKRLGSVEGRIIVAREHIAASWNGSSSDLCMSHLSLACPLPKGEGIRHGEYAKGEFLRGWT